MLTISYYQWVKAQQWLHSARGTSFRANIMPSRLQAKRRLVACLALACRKQTPLVVSYMVGYYEHYASLSRVIRSHDESNAPACHGRCASSSNALLVASNLPACYEQCSGSQRAFCRWSSSRDTMLKWQQQHLKWLYYLNCNY